MISRWSWEKVGQALMLVVPLRLTRRVWEPLLIALLSFSFSLSLLIHSSCHLCLLATTYKFITMFSFHCLLLRARSGACLAALRLSPRETTLVTINAEKPDVTVGAISSIVTVHTQIYMWRPTAPDCNDCIVDIDIDTWYHVIYNAHPLRNIRFS